MADNDGFEVIDHDEFLNQISGIMNGLNESKRYKDCTVYIWKRDNIRVYYNKGDDNYISWSVYDNNQCIYQVSAKSNTIKADNLAISFVSIRDQAIADIRRYLMNKFKNQ